MVLENDQPYAGDSQLDVPPVRVFTIVQADPVHLEPLGVLQEVDFSLARRLSLFRRKHTFEKSLQNFFNE